MFKWINVSHALTHFNLLRLFTLVERLASNNSDIYWVHVIFLPYDEKWVVYIGRLNSTWHLINYLTLDKSQGHGFYVWTCRSIKCRKYAVAESLTCPFLESIMYFLQLVGGLFLVLGVCYGLDLYTTECEKNCNKEVRIYVRFFVLWCMVTREYMSVLWRHAM